jgi:hypothetical protein
MEIRGSRTELCQDLRVSRQVIIVDLVERDVRRPRTPRRPVRTRLVGTAPVAALPVLVPVLLPLPLDGGGWEGAIRGGPLSRHRERLL